MIDAFVEGVRSIVQACHLVIIAPVAMVIIAARGRWQAVAGAVAGVVIGGYVFVMRWLILTDAQLRLSALAVIAVLVVLLLPTLFRGDQPVWLKRLGAVVESPWAAAIMAMMVGIVVTLWWRPCVGEALGDILTLAPNEPWGQLLPTIGFMLGIAIPLVVIGLVYAAAQPSNEIVSRLSIAAAGLGVLLAGSVVIGQHGEIVSRLFEWSQ